MSLGENGVPIQRQTTPRGINEKEKVTMKSLRRLLESQQYRCAISGVKLTPKLCSLDHIVALSRGGEDCIGNCQLVHREMNRMKGCLTMEEFRKWCEMVIGWEGDGDHVGDDSSTDWQNGEDSQGVLPGLDQG